MEDINIELKPKKKSLLNKIKDLFEDKNKRILYITLFIMPFVVAIGIFGYIAFKETKNLINLATGTTEVNDNHVISSMKYTLRDNATEYQKECFAELKNAVETGADENTIVGLVAKNYVADFYTWTNKQGQYDVGGMEYVNSEKNETIEYRQNIYIKARDGFYKYLNEYINQYGASNLLEIQSINVTNVSNNDYLYIMHEYIETIQTGEDTWEKIYDNVEYKCFNVSLTWTYKPETKLNLSDYATSINLLVIENDGRYEIVEASEKEIDGRPTEQPESESGEDEQEEDE